MKVKVFLNQEGKKLWGDVFPSGEVPVMSMTFSESNLGRVILVAWEALTTLERELIVEKISNLSNVPKDVILRDIKEKGLPMRESLTTGSVVAELRWFI